MKLPSALLAVTLAALTVGSLAAVDIVAHRGASFDAPENTLAAEKLAWKQQADAVETDIYLTKDGKLIVSHDKTTKRTAGRDAAIADLTLAELQTELSTELSRMTLCRALRQLRLTLKKKS